jgi:hypothetical protein
LSHRLFVSLALLACAFGLVAARAEAARLAPVSDALADGDPLAFAPARVPALERAAAFGHSGPLYVRSPGGVVETARRTARFRSQIERAVRGSGFSPDILEGLVFLESAGRPDAIAGDGPLAASGLVQIMGETATGFLGMNVNLHASGVLTRRIAAARARGRLGAARRLEAQRRRIDPRFDPPQALAAAVRYLTAARGYLGRNDLAVVSYHMGIGNLQNVLRAYAGTPDADVPYAQLFFDSGPDRNPAAWERLLRLGDDSRHYYFKVLAAKRIMHLYRTNPRVLASLAVLHARKHSHEEVMHPSWRTRVFTAPREVAQARGLGTLQPLPDRPKKLHFEISSGMGSLARSVGARQRLYRALRPEALATLAYLAQRVHQIGNTRTPLLVTSTVRDWRYQSRLMRTNSMAARSYSIHTTGYAFDIARAWTSTRQAAAVQFVLDRLVAHGLIAYIKEPHAIHVAVSKDAKVLVPAMLVDRDAPAAPPAPPEPPVEPPVEAPAEPPAEPAALAPALPAPELVEPKAELPQRRAKSQRPAEEQPGFFEQLRDILGL